MLEATRSYKVVRLLSLEQRFYHQGDEIKIAKCLLKLPKYDFTRKMIDFGTFKKLAKNVGDLGKLFVARGFKKITKSAKKSPNLVTLFTTEQHMSKILK